MAEPFFREIEHTADVGIEVEADSAADLFACAGRALFSLMVNLEHVQRCEERQISVQAEGWGDLFHDWLSHLLLEFLQDGFIAAQITIEGIGETQVQARLAGEKLYYGKPAPRWRRCSKREFWQQRRDLPSPKESVSAGR